jgi:DNA topoisomerase IA
MYDSQLTTYPRANTTHLDVDFIKDSLVYLKTLKNVDPNDLNELPVDDY